MKDTCFVTEANNRFWNMAQGLLNSIRKFYPDSGLFCHPYTDTKCIASQNDQYVFDKDPGISYDFLLSYFDKYKRVVFMNADMIMCSKCPELFEDFEFGMALNNIDMPYTPGKQFLQNGFMTVTNPQVFKDMTEYNKTKIDPYYDMYSANKIFYSGKYKTKIFSFGDKIYGVQEQGFYKYAFLDGKDIICGNKKVFIFHFSGPDWKDYNLGNYRFEKFKPEVQERLKELLN
jgi:hypothetical protein